PVLFGDHGGEFGSRLAAQESVQGVPAPIVATVEPGEFADWLIAAALGRALAFDLIEGLAHRQHDQQTPEVVPVGEPGESAAVDAPAEAVEGTQRRVLLVLASPRTAGVLELLPRQANEPLEVALPEVLRRGIPAGLQAADPARDRTLALGFHRMASPRRPVRQSAPIFEVDCNSVRPLPGDRSFVGS